MKIGIINYNACNLASIYFSLYRLGYDPILINNKNSIDFIDKDRVNLTFKKKQYGTYHIIKKVSNCFYLEKYD